MGLVNGKQVALLLALSIQIASCAGPKTVVTSKADDECTKINSWVICLLELYSLDSGVVDMTQEAAKKAGFQAALREGGATGAAIIGAAQFTPLASRPLPGLSRQATGALWLLSAVPVYDPGKSKQFFAIVPESQVVNGDPTATLEQAWIKAVAALLGATEIEARFTEKRPSLAGPYYLKNYIIKGGERCGEAGCAVSADFFESRNFPDKELNDRRKPIVVEAAPKWIAPFGAPGERLYLFGNYWSRMHPRVIDPQGKEFWPIISVEDKLRFLALLPDWFLFYEPTKPTVMFNRTFTAYGILPSKQ
jgi:hypothetical protein